MLRYRQNNRTVTAKLANQGRLVGVGQGKNPNCLSRWCKDTVMTAVSLVPENPDHGVIHVEEGLELFQATPSACSGYGAVQWVTAYTISGIFPGHL